MNSISSLKIESSDIKRFHTCLEYESLFLTHQIDEIVEWHIPELQQQRGHLAAVWNLATKAVIDVFGEDEKARVLNVVDRHWQNHIFSCTTVVQVGFLPQLCHEKVILMYMVG